MNTRREANLVLMAHWAQAWTTLGRWQELNSRLSKDPPPRGALTLKWRGAYSHDRQAGASATAG